MFVKVMSFLSLIVITQYCHMSLFVLGHVYRRGCEILPCRVGPGLGPSTQFGHHLQGPQT